jgi:hypothetical protein
VEEALTSAPQHAQLIWSPVETLTRFLAIAHTIVATLFLLSSRRVRTPAGLRWITGLAALGVLLCLGFSAMGGLGAALGVVAFFAYFLAHEVRDELFFYRITGDAPRTRRDRAPWRWVALLVAGIMVTFAVAFLAGARARRLGVVGPLPLPQMLIALTMLGVGAAVGLAAVRRLIRDAGGWRRALAADRPLIVVLGGLYLVLMGGFVVTGRGYMFVAVHVTVWFVFALRRMEAPAGLPPRPFTWPWLRATRPGFITLHGGVMAAVVVAAACWAFGFANASEPALFGMILSRESFPYWTIMHVTLSWLPRSVPAGG